MEEIEQEYSSYNASKDEGNLLSNPKNDSAFEIFGEHKCHYCKSEQFMCFLENEEDLASEGFINITTTGRNILQVEFSN